MPDQEIIKDRQIVSDSWHIIRLNENQSPDDVIVPEDKVIVPLAVWQAQRESLIRRNNGRLDVGVWLASSERAESLKNDMGIVALIAVDFPVFSDGRGYSIAYNLRSKLGYLGELRAIGDVLRDQLFYMHRVGFNAFVIRSDRSVRDAIQGLTDFSESYQASVDQKLPLFRRVKRPSREGL